jgi:colicin import membrane protein
VKTTDLEPEDNDELPRGLVVSFVVHAVIISFFTLKAVFLTPESIDYSAAIRVDIVGLPDKVKPEDVAPPAATKEEAKTALPDKPEKTPPPPKPVEKPVEKPAEKAVKMPAKKDLDTVNLEKTKHDQKNALEKLKAMAAVEKLKEDAANEKKKKEAAAGTAAAGGPKLKGNVISPGTAITGLAKLQHDSYVVDLDHHIKRNWALPEWLAKRDLKAQVRVTIDSNGNVLSRRISKTSGNSSYDEEVLATIDRSAPFPKPPDKFTSVLAVDGILIGFPE